MPPPKKLSDEHLGPFLKMMPRKLCKGGFVSLAVSVFASMSVISKTNAAASIASRADFDWNKMTPSPNLTWVKCFDTHECARLEVPLDYSDPTGEKAAVAMLRIKAKVSPDSKNYRGPVLFNPGGPGASGISQVLADGDQLQRIVGDEFDIVGFDPRGVGETTPKVFVFSDTAEKAAWDGGAPPMLNSTQDALLRGFSRAELFNGLIESRSKKATEHASTAVVARDMLSITKAHGRDRLQYWGVSYGSVLGATFSAMFPNNVERLLIDGVLDFDDYLSGTWSRNLLDADKALQFLYDQCAKAGSACPLHAPSGALVRQRVDEILTSIKAHPMPVINGTDYAVLDYSSVKSGLFISLFTPFASFAPLAAALAALEGGDGRPFLELFGPGLPLPTCAAPPSSGVESRQSIACAEGVGANNTIPDILEHFEEQSKISMFADFWTDTTRTGCAGWKVQAKERFTGPFAVNTSFPLLIIGNTADPLTPLAGAKKAAGLFGGSGLLTINTPGHTSLVATSNCSQKIINEYFVHGKLPKAGTVCEIEDVLFGEPPATSGNSSVQRRELVAAARSFARSFRVPRHGEH